MLVMLSNVSDVDILFRYLDRLGNNNLVKYIIISQKLIVLLLLIGAHTFSVNCFFTIKNVTLNAMLANLLANKVTKYSSKGKQMQLYWGCSCLKTARSAL